MSNNEERSIDLINDLLQQDSELSWLEFKKNNSDKELVGKLCSALSNSARLEGRDFGYVIWGIDDETQEIIGTDFNPDAQTVGNQPFNLWLAQRLKPSISFAFKVIHHPHGRIVLLEVSPATSIPTAFNGTAYIRVGSATPKLEDYPERYKKLIESLRQYEWENGIAKQYISGDEILNLLDYTPYFRLTRQPLPDNRDGIFEKLEADNLITRDVGGKWSISNLGAILLAIDLNQFGSSLARKGVRVTIYMGEDKTSKVKDRRDNLKGYASGFESLIDYINAALPENEHIGDALRESHPLFPKLAVRELVANALIHQDMTITGAGPKVEVFKDRVEISNPGKPLIKTDRMIDLPPRSRNEKLASLMRRMGFCEEEGSGLDKVIKEVEIYQLPPPLFREGDNSIQAILYGPRKFANMTPDERIRACYQHAVLKFLGGGDRMKNASLSERLGIKEGNKAQTSSVISQTLAKKLIRVADSKHPRAGYVPFWA